MNEDTLQFILSLALSSGMGAVSAIAVALLKRKPKTQSDAETGLAEAQSEKTASETWRDLAEELKKSYEELERKTNEKFLVLDNENQELRKRLEIEKDARIRIEQELGKETAARLNLEEELAERGERIEQLERKFKTIRTWFEKNSKKIQEAKIEPLPIEI